jgi:hypothetical protein
MSKVPNVQMPKVPNAEKEGDIVDVLCDCGQTHSGKVTGDEGQGLEWFCPIEGEEKSDVNA